VVWSEEAGSETGPRSVIEAVVAAMNGEGASLGVVGWVDGELDSNGGVRRKEERSFDGELVDAGEADAICGDESEFYEGGSREDDVAEDGVICEPEMVGESESSGEEEAVVVGELDGCAKERMVSGGETGGSDVRGARSSVVEPETLPLKGIGGEVDALSAERLEERLPVE
jgi:hypothetical protein